MLRLALFQLPTSYGRLFFLRFPETLGRPLGRLARISAVCYTLRLIAHLWHSDFVELV